MNHERGRRRKIVRSRGYSFSGRDGVASDRAFLPCSHVDADMGLRRVVCKEATEESSAQREVAVGRRGW
jgi:hypothetical protein